jgi:hypothetical protein
MNALLLKFLTYTVLIVIFLGPLLWIWRSRSTTCLPWGIFWLWLGLILCMPSHESLTAMSAPLLEFFANTELVVTFLGPILLIWRLGLRAGFLSGILWFWLGLMLWVPLASAVDVANYRLHYHSEPHRDSDDDIIGFFIVFFYGFPLSLIYCGLLSLSSLLAGALKVTLKEIKANKRRE